MKQCLNFSAKGMKSRLIKDNIDVNGAPRTAVLKNG